MHDADTNALLDAVDALTKADAVVLHAPVFVCDLDDRPPLYQVWQDAIPGRQLERLAYWRAEEGPTLIGQLRDAAAGGTGSHAPSTEARIPINAGAIEYHTLIEDTVSEWYIELTGKPPFLLPEETLRQWYLAYVLKQSQQPNADDTVERARIKQLESWAAGITRFFNPPDATLEITRPCSRCGESTWFDPKTGQEFGYPVVVHGWRIRETASLDYVEASCRSCGYVWKSGLGLRELAWELEHEEDEPEAVPV